MRTHYRTHTREEGEKGITTPKTLQLQNSMTWRRLETLARHPGDSDGKALLDDSTALWRYWTGICWRLWLLVDFWLKFGLPYLDGAEPFWVSCRYERWPGSVLSLSVSVFFLLSRDCATCPVSPCSTHGRGSGNVAAFSSFSRPSYLAPRPTERAPARWRLALGRAVERRGSRQRRALARIAESRELRLLASFSVSWALYVFFGCWWRMKLVLTLC